MPRKLISVVLLFLFAVLAHAQEEDPWRILGETWRSEGLYNDTDSLLRFMDKSLSFDFSLHAGQAGPLGYALGDYSLTPSPDKIKAGAGMLRNHIDSSYTDKISEKGLVACAELGYFGYISGIDSLINYSYKSYTEAFKQKEENFLALYYSINDRRYIRSPFIVLGDVMLRNGHPDYAQSFYRQAYPLDVYSPEYLQQSSPDSIYDSIWSDRGGQEMYKSTYSYPIHMDRLAKAAYRSGEPNYEAYLNEAFYYAAERLFWSYISLDIFEQERLIALYSTVFSHQYGNHDTGWAYDAALFIKGCSNSMYADIRSAYLREGEYMEPVTAAGKPQHTGALFPKQVIVDYQTAMENFRLDPTELNRQKVRSISRDMQNRLIFSDAPAPSLTLTYRDILDFLRPDEAAVEFVRVVPLGTQEPEYHALIISRRTEKPTRVFLCKESQLLELISNDPVGIYSTGSKALYNLIWKPMASSLEGMASIYYAPDGILNSINPDAATAEDGSRIYDSVNSIRLSSTRDIAKYQRKTECKDAVLYGGLTYNMTPKAMKTENARYDGYKSATRGLEPGQERNGWKDLPGTRAEVNRIAGLMSQRGCSVHVLSGTEGSEESFKNLSWHSPDILHLATHGFFIKGEKASSPYMQSLILSGEYSGLRRSGLVLSGGQRAWLGESVPSRVEDGILLAEEIANLDLSGTGLVVLSACETALGSLSEQGVDGLQRVLKKAGAGKLVMSLWNVDDKATMLFMTRFYESLLSSNDTAGAFRSAQHFMCSSDIYSDPYYWAGFILVE